MIGRNIYLTLDFEEDLGTALPITTHEAIEKTSSLLSIISDNKIPLTVFCTGRILQSYYKILEPLIEYGAEIELHSFDHADTFKGTSDRIQNMKKGLDIYRNRFGKTPMGYRAPNGMIDFAALQVLSQEGVKYDSSVFPTFFPGRFNFNNCPRTPFKIRGTSLLELPFATTRFLRIPISLSYIQLFGDVIYINRFQKYSFPKEIVFDFHMHDLVKGGWHKRSGVPLMARFGYSRAQSMPDPSIAFRKLVNFFLEQGDSFKFLSSLYREQVAINLPEVSLVE
jgi:hypothetical protein